MIYPGILNYSSKMAMYLNSRFDSTSLNATLKLSTFLAKLSQTSNRGF